jgi:hypothetical protein
MRHKYSIIVNGLVGIIIVAIIVMLVNYILNSRQINQLLLIKNEVKSVEKVKLITDSVKKKTGLSNVNLVFSDQDLLLIEESSHDYKHDFGLIDVDQLYRGIEREIDKLSGLTGMNSSMLYILAASRGCLSTKRSTISCKNGENGVGPWKIPIKVTDEYRIESTDDSVLTDVYKSYFSWFRSKTNNDLFFIMFLGESTDTSVTKYWQIYNNYTDELIAQPSKLIDKIPGLKQSEYRRLINYFGAGIALYNKIPSAN